MLLLDINYDSFLSRLREVSEKLNKYSFNRFVCVISFIHYAFALFSYSEKKKKTIWGFCLLYIYIFYFLSP